MGRGLCRTLLLVPALLTAALFALPVWDHWYYSPTRLGSSSGIAATPAYATGRDNRPVAPEPGAASPQSPLMMAGLSPAPSVAAPAGEVKASAPALPARSLVLQRASSAAASPVANVVRAVSHTEGAPPASGRTQPSPWTQPPPAPASREIGVAQAVGSFPYPIALAAAPARPPSQPAPASPAASSALQQPAVVRAPVMDDPPPDAPVQPSRVSLVPNRTTLAPGDSLIVQVQANAAQAVSSVPFHLGFDPSVLQYVGAREGEVFAATSLQPILLASVNDARPGDLAVGVALVKTSGLLRQPGSVVVLEFRALAPGVSELVFDRASLRGETGEPLPSQFSGVTITVR